MSGNKTSNVLASSSNLSKLYDYSLGEESATSTPSRTASFIQIVPVKNNDTSALSTNESTQNTGSLPDKTENVTSGGDLQPSSKDSGSVLTREKKEEALDKDVLNYVLPGVFVRLAEQSCDAFEAEDRYLIHLEALFYLRFMIYDCKSLHSNTFYTGLGTGFKSKLPLLQQAFEQLEQLYAEIYRKTDQKLTAYQLKHNKLPRIERLIQKLKLTDREADGLRYLWVINAGILFPHFNGAVYSAHRHRKFEQNLHIASRMTPSQIINFLSSQREYIKDGLVELMAGRAPKFNNRVLTALLDAHISGEEMLMLHNTVIGEILREDGITPNTLQPKKNEKKNEEKEKTEVPKVSPDWLNEPNREKTVVEVLDLLRKSQVEAEMKKEVKEDLPNGKESQTEPNETISSTKPMKFDQKNDAGDKEKNLTNDNKPKESKREDNLLSAYTNDLDYLQDHFEVIVLRFRLLRGEMNSGLNDDFPFNDTYAQQQQQRRATSKRETEAKHQQSVQKCKIRLEATMQEGIFLPRVEKLVKELKLDVFEKWVMLTLVAQVLSADVRKQLRYQARAITVEILLSLHCAELREQIEKRKYFYKGATLIKEGIVTMQEGGMGANLMSAVLEMDRRMVDYCVALDTEFKSLVEGSVLFTPTVTLERVILPEEIKMSIVSRVQHLKDLQKKQEEYGFIEHGYGNGLVLLFHGISGTGKTLMANALANCLGKKILLANFPTLRIAHASHKTDNGVKDTFRFIFREAKIQNAIIFFDECESLFESRDFKSLSSEVNTALSCIEQYDDIIIMATNRPYDLDEAMYRRIHMVVEFPPPDMHLRQKIWEKHFPPNLPLADDVDVGELAMKFELTGGFIRNAVLAAMQTALLRDKENLKITQSDLLSSCEQQIMGQLQLTGFDERVLPKIRLRELCLEQTPLQQCYEIIALLKGKKVLTGQWGFKDTGTRILLIGPTGCGKSSVAEAIAYECGKPMKVLSCAEMLVSSNRSLDIGTTHSRRHKMSWERLFSEVNTGALFVVRNCELLFSESIMNVSTLGYIIHQLKRSTSTFIFIFDGVLEHGDIVNLNQAQKGLLHLFHFVIRFEKPSLSMRSRLWRSLIPKNTPVMPDIDFDELGKQFSDFVQTDIMATIHMAAATACLRQKDDCVLKMEDMIKAGERHKEKRLSKDFRGIIYT